MRIQPKLEAGASTQPWTSATIAAVEPQTWRAGVAVPTPTLPPVVARWAASVTVMDVSAM